MYSKHLEFSFTSKRVALFRGEQKKATFYPACPKLHLRFTDYRGNVTPSSPAIIDSGSDITTISDEVLGAAQADYQRTNSHAFFNTASGGKPVMRELIYLRVALWDQTRGKQGEFFEMLCALWECRKHGELERTLLSMNDLMSLYQVKYRPPAKPDISRGEREAPFGTIELDERWDFANSVVRHRSTFDKLTSL